MVVCSAAAALALSVCNGVEAGVESVFCSCWGRMLVSGLLVGTVGLMMLVMVVVMVSWDVSVSPFVLVVVMELRIV